MGPKEIFVSAQLGLAELALSGCTMSADHLYLYPNGARLDDSIEAARTIGLRFHPTRGSMSIGESAGGLPPDRLVEAGKAILEDCIRVIDSFHDPSDGAMLRIGLCAVLTLFRQPRSNARNRQPRPRQTRVMLHTHLAENDEDVADSQERFGCLPGQYAEELGWVGDDV